MSKITAAAVNSEEETAALVQLLHETQQRLQELNGRELDAVLHPNGQHYLLHEAQGKLQHSEEAQRRLALTQSSILNALPANIALIDHDGVILSVNDGWRRFAAEGGLDSPTAGLGQNYLHVCDVASGESAEEAHYAAAGVRSVLEGAASSFTFEYPCHLASQRHWFRLMANPMVNGAVVMHIDITERKLAEEALRESEERFRSLFDAAAAGIATSTPHGRYLQTNAAYCQMLGYTEAELRTRDFASVTHPEDLLLNLNLRDELLAGERASFVMEKRYIRKGGEIIWVRMSVSATHGAAGEITALIVIAEDITWRKKAREELLESEKRFATAFEFAPNGVALMAKDGRWMKVNRALMDMLGYSEVEFLARTALDMTHPDDTKLSWNNIRRALAGETNTYQCEKRYLHKNGRTIPVLLNVSLVHDSQGQPVYFVSQIQDFTERKRTEARFRRLVDSDVQGVFFWNKNGAVTGANNSFLRLTGYTRDDLDAGRVRWTTMTPPEYAARDQHALREIDATGRCTPYEKQYIRADGSTVFVLLGSTNFEDSPEEGVCFVLDLTERKEIEQQFLRAQRLESIGFLAGGIAHDLNNCLTPVISALELLEIQCLDPKSRKLLDVLGSSARRGAQIVRQILLFARGGVEGQRLPVDIKHLVGDLKNIIDDTFLKHIQVRVKIPKDIWTVLGDSTQLHQVLLNLCVNARDAMPAGGRLTISAENLTLDSHYAGMEPEARPGRYVVIHVQDQGTGIPPDVIKKIFDPFFTTKEVGKGTGLGLSSSLGIIKSHGGFIRVYSEPGTGTVFKIYLPAPYAAPSGSSPERKPDLPRGHGELILVVDDEPAVRQVTKETLETFGYQVIAAADGAEGITEYAARPSEFAAVITDMMMPVVDGATFMRVLRHTNPNVRIIASSGHFPEHRLSEAGGMENAFFLPKPYSAELLLTTLRNALER
jgi:PAS domain S-box-containing protein